MSSETLYQKIKDNIISLDSIPLERLKELAQAHKNHSQLKNLISEAICYY